MSGLLCGKMTNSKIVMFWDPYCFNTTIEFKKNLRKHHAQIAPGGCPLHKNWGSPNTNRETQG